MTHRFIPLNRYRRYPEEEMERRAASFYEDLDRRRTVRDFSAQPVRREVIESCLLAAGTAPSGAHRQPWHFVVVSDPAVKHRIRVAAEEEERAFLLRPKSSRRPPARKDRRPHSHNH